MATQQIRERAKPITEPLDAIQLKILRLLHAYNGEALSSDLAGGCGILVAQGAVVLQAHGRDGSRGERKTRVALGFDSRNVQEDWPISL